MGKLQILSVDDLSIRLEDAETKYEYYEEKNRDIIDKYNEIYREKIIQS